MSNAVQIYQNNKQLTTFSDVGAFEFAQRQAKALAESDLVPTMYKGKVANCLVALEVAQRCGASVLAVMQNMNIIHGKPSWSSTYVIGAINACGKFAPLNFKVAGDGDNKFCYAWTTNKDGEVIEGPPVSIAMAKAEGWYGKNGSKWPNMPDLMLRYRAASFFGRLYAPEVLLGMRTDDEEREIIDVNPDGVIDTNPDGVIDTVLPKNAAAEINKKIRSRKAEKAGEQAKTLERSDEPPSTPAPQTDLPAATATTTAATTATEESHF